MMTGWKTWASAISMILTGLGTALTGILGDEIDIEKVSSGIAMASIGGGMIGIGHKVERKEIKRYVVKARDLKKLIEK